MTLLFFLKTLAEFAFYFSFGNYFAATGGGSTIPFYVAILPIVAMFLCYLLREKPQKMRLLPLILLAPGFFFITGTATIIVYAIACIYCITLAARKVFYQSYDTAAINFKRCAICLCVLPIMTMVVGGMKVLSDNCAPYVLVFLCASVLQTRMLRHDARTLESRGFQMQNLIAVALILGLGMLSTTPIILSWVSTAGKFLYMNMVIPIIELLMYGVMGIIWAILKVLSFIFPKFKPTFPPAEEIQLIMGLGDDMEYSQVTKTPEVVTWIFAGIGIVLLILAGAYIIKKLTERRHQNNHLAEFYDKREQLEKREEPRKREFFAPRDPRAAVRHYYAKFLQECHKYGVVMAQSSTATDIAENAEETLDKNAVKELTSLYIIARYSAKEIDKNDVKTAKTAYNTIKNSKTEDKPHE